MAYYTGVIAQIQLGDTATPTDILAQCTSYSVDKQLESVDMFHIYMKAQQQVINILLVRLF